MLGVVISMVTYTMQRHGGNLAFGEKVPWAVRLSDPRLNWHPGAGAWRGQDRNRLVPRQVAEIVYQVAQLVQGMGPLRA